MSTDAHATEYAVYIGAADAEVDLEPLKIYRVVAAEPSDPPAHLRVVDESGEDYLYPADQFEPIQVPDRVAAAIGERT